MDTETNTKIDMSLDDIIRMEGIKGPRRFGAAGQRNQRRGYPRFNSTGSGIGRYRSFQNRNIPKRPYNNYQNRSRSLSLNNRSPYQPATLHISNLATNVTSDDLNELFSSFGNLKRAFVHYDQYGASLCTAEVEFERKDEAIAARNKLNNVPLDRKPLKITMINVSNDDAFTSFLKFTTINNNRRQFNDNNFNNRSRRNNFNRGNQRRSNNRNQNLNADDLDREMDEWRSKMKPNNFGSSQTNGNDGIGDSEEMI